MKLSWFFLSVSFLISNIFFRKSKQDENDNVFWTERKEIEQFSLNGVKRLKGVSQGRSSNVSKKEDELLKKVQVDRIWKKKTSINGEREIKRACHDPAWYRMEIIWRNTIGRHCQSLFGAPIEVIDMKKFFFDLQPETQSLLLKKYRKVSRFEEELDSLSSFERAVFDLRSITTQELRSASSFEEEYEILSRFYKSVLDLQSVIFEELELILSSDEDIDIPSRCYEAVEFDLQSIMSREFLSSGGEGDFLSCLSEAVESDLQEFKSSSGPWEQSEFFSHFFEAVFDQMILDGLDEDGKKGEEPCHRFPVKGEEPCHRFPVKYKNALSARCANMHYSSGKKRRRKWYVRSDISASDDKQPFEVYETDVDVELEKMKGELNIYTNRM